MTLTAKNGRVWKSKKCVHHVLRSDVCEKCANAYLRRKKREDVHEMMEDYKVIKNLTKVGNKYGLSRERVRQIRIREGVENLSPLKFLDDTRTQNFCNVCRRIFRGRVRHAGDNMCTACKTYSKIGKGTIIRQLLYPKTCKICGKGWEDRDFKKRRNGMHEYCALKSDPVAWERHKKYMREYWMKKQRGKKDGSSYEYALRVLRGRIALLGETLVALKREKIPTEGTEKIYAIEIEALQLSIKKLES